MTIYRGLPVRAAARHRALQPLRGSGVTLEPVPPAAATTFTDHKLRSKDDAENLVIQLERGQLDSVSARNRELLALSRRRCC